jgi:hypothetical protein
VLALDFDALVGRELELHVVVEQPTIHHVQSEEHTCDDARPEVREELEHSHKEALVLTDREEVGPG